MLNKTSTETDGIMHITVSLIKLQSGILFGRAMAKCSFSIHLRRPHYGNDLKISKATSVLTRFSDKDLK